MGFFRRLVALFRRRRLEREIDDELAVHLALRQEEENGRGMPTKDAKLASHRQVGNVLRVKEQSKEAWLFGGLESVAQDVRFALRGLRRAPAFALVVILTLACGIGANSTIFSVLDTYLFRPLSYPEADRLVRVWRTAPQSQNWPHSAATFLDLRDRNDVFEYMVAVNAIAPALIDEGHAAERLQGIGITADFFPALSNGPTDSIITWQSSHD
jgi:putative ABC transport system permease protein